MVGQNGTSHLRLLAAVIIVASETIVKRGLNGAIEVTACDP